MSKGRTDTLVCGPISTDQFFGMGGFVLSKAPGASSTEFMRIGPTAMYMSYLNDIYLIEGWYDAPSTYEMLYFRWEWAWNDMNIPEGTKFPIHLVAYTLTNKVYKLKSKLAVNNNFITFSGGFGGLPAAVFDLADFVYDWSDGYLQLQAGNQLVPKQEWLVNGFYSSNIGGNFPTGIGDATIAPSNFIPFPLDWFTGKGQYSKLVKTNQPIIDQQCFRARQSDSRNSCSPDGLLPGVTVTSLAYQSQYQPYFVSNNGCAKTMAPKTTVDLLGNTITTEQGSNTYGIAKGYCFRNKIGLFGDQTTIPYPDTPTDCRKAAADPSCKSTLCSMCTPSTCPDAFSGWQPIGSDSITKNKVWVWILMGIIILIVLILLGYGLYNRTYKQQLDDMSTEDLFNIAKDNDDREQTASMFDY